MFLIIKSTIGFLANVIFRKHKNEIENVVSNLENTDMGGTEKKKQLLEIVKNIKTNWSGWFLNLALEVIVAYVKMKMGKKVDL